MKLKSIQYKQNEGKPGEWSLEGCTLGDINLMVGKNATGKTRTLEIISALTDLFLGKRKPGLNVGQLEVIFDRDIQEIKYKIVLEANRVISEELTEDGQILLKRNADGNGEILAEQFKQMMRFQTEEELIAIAAKKDSIQHPFLELLYNWGKSARHFQFGTPMGQYSMPSLQVDFQKIDLKDSDWVVGILKRGLDEHGDEYKQLILADMSKIGYELEDISIESVSGRISGIVSTVALAVQIKEKDLDVATSQSDISTGMFRALSLLVQLNYSLLASLPSCIIIDDIGEGLDYIRSSALIKVIIDKIKQTNMQLVMSTNYELVMDSVPLEYWSLIRRLPKKSKLYNYRNAKKIFDDFDFTGLSNYDFFASDYFDKALKQLED